MPIQQRFSPLAALPALAVAGMLIAGCGHAGEPGPAPAATASVTARSGQAPVPSTDNEALLAAGRTALEHVADARVIGLESEHGGSHWEVELATPDGRRMKLHTSADGQRIERDPRQSRHSDKSRAKWRKRLQAARLDFVQASHKISTLRPGRITELELDHHRGHVAWEADVRANGNKYEVKIDAADGSVLENKRD